MSTPTNSLIQSEYISKINKVQDYIEANLRGNLSLDILADISGFSKFHFSRIFRGVMKETLVSYINRIRLERATSLLLRNPQMSITEIAMQFGFSDSAVFARSFKKYYGMSASEARKKFRKNCKVESKDGKANIILPRYNKEEANVLRKDNLINGNVEVKIIEEIKAIYLRHTGSYEELAADFQGLLSKLVNWALARNLIKYDGIKLFSIYHDNPEFTQAKNLKTSICLVVSRDVNVDGDIGQLEIPSGKYAIGHFTTEQSEHSAAWDYFYGEWLLKSGFQPADGYIFEMFLNDPNTHPENKHIFDIYLPVKPL